MVKAKGLGRGLDALLLSGEEDVQKNEGSLQTLLISELQPGKYQPRSIMQEEALHALSQSILKQGVMQPIIVRPVGNNQYEIIAGERRWRAAKLANLNEVPVIIKNIPDESALAMALIENIQREDLNPLEEAIGIKRLIDEFDMTHEEAADAVGKSRVTVSNLLRLLTLTKPVQDRLLSGKIDMGHARALIGLEGSQQIMLCEEAIGIKRLIDEFNMTHEEAADAVGKSRVTVSNLLRLLTLTKPVQDRLLSGKIDMGHARALIGLEGSQQIMLCEEVIQKNLSVREVEALVKNLQNSYKIDSQKPSPKKINADVRQLEESLAETLGASVTIDAKKNGSGILKVHYRNLEQLDEILKKIKG